ncbi:MAG: winged helix-turn-helix domain-containing protein, partial [Myxococcota bacterium]
MTTRRFILGDRHVDLDRATVTTGDEVVALTANEVGLLGVLVANAGSTVPRERLLTEGLGYRRALQTRAIDQAIWRLRRKLEDEGRPPRFLHSNPHEGYRLDLDQSRPAPEALIGRSDELARLLAWIDAGVPDVWLVGLPGSGRSSLAQVVDGLRPGHTTRWHVADRTPATSVGVLRIPPLAPADGRALLSRVAAAAQGLPEPPLADLPALDALADAVGGHAASLVALGRRTLLEPVTSIRPEGTLGRWLAERSPELVEAVTTWTVFPDRFDAADVEETGHPRGTLARAWEECLVEGRAGSFTVTPVVRSALAPGPGDLAALVRRVRVQVEPWLGPAIDRGEDTARAALAALRPRIELAVARDPDDEALLWAWSFTGPSHALAAAIAPTAPAARVLCACIRVLAGIAGPEAIDAVRDLPVDSALALLRLRTELRLAVRRGQDSEGVGRLLPGFDAELARAATPMAVAGAHQARGLWFTRAG